MVQLNPRELSDVGSSGPSDSMRSASLLGWTVIALFFGAWSLTA
jgi:hypothetical protein